jgi:hypothetical protein
MFCACTDIFEQPAPLPEITAPGFLGYAVDFMQVRPDMQDHMRLALADLFKDLSVWSTAAEAHAYEVSCFAELQQQQQQQQLQQQQQQQQQQHQHALQAGVNVQQLLRPLNFVSLDSFRRPLALALAGKPCISHWRLRRKPLADTSESLAAAVERCRTAVLSARESRRALDKVLDRCGSECVSDSENDSDRYYDSRIDESDTDDDLDEET